jgi:hypothetical protein
VTDSPPLCSTGGGTYSHSRSSNGAVVPGHMIGLAATRNSSASEIRLIAAVATRTHHPTPTLPGFFRRSIPSVALRCGRFTCSRPHYSRSLPQSQCESPVKAHDVLAVSDLTCPYPTAGRRAHRPRGRRGTVGRATVDHEDIVVALGPEVRNAVAVVSVWSRVGTRTQTAFRSIPVWCRGDGITAAGVDRADRIRSC